MRMIAASTSIRRAAVSIRARPIGRAMPECDFAAARRLSVSIRARPIGRAMRTARAAMRTIRTMFQSAPGQLAGRCASHWHRSLQLRGCFNPRPANWPGDAVQSGHDAAMTAVSIRARPIGRAMRPVQAPIADQHRFNPRPANRPGDAARSRSAGHGRAAFQSAPGQLAGRCHAARSRGCARTIAFQSAPGQLAGRCVADQHERAAHAMVSIRARPIGRAMPCRRRRPACAPVVSIRARPIGRAMRARSHAAAEPIRVSIRARPIGRAMRRCRMPAADASAVSIRARPIGRAMPALPAGRHRRCTRFQSAPGQLAGRCASPRQCCGSVRHGFNPRPANWPGDALRPADGHRSAHVSIRARPIGRAMPDDR